LIHAPGGPQSGLGLLGLRARRRRLLPATEATEVDDQSDHEGEDDPADHERPSVHKASLHPRILPIGGPPCGAGSRCGTARRYHSLNERLRRHRRCGEPRWRSAQRTGVLRRTRQVGRATRRSRPPPSTASASLVAVLAAQVLDRRLAVRRGFPVSLDLEEGQVLAVGLPQHPDEHHPQRPVLLAVDQ